MPLAVAVTEQLPVTLVMQNEKLESVALAPEADGPKITVTPFTLTPFAVTVTASGVAKAVLMEADCGVPLVEI